MKKSIRIIALIIVIALGIELVPGSVFAESKLGEIMPETEDIGNKEDISNKDIGVHTVSELLFLREENRKTYRLSDGSEAVAEYEKPVHYKSGDEWLEVDSSLYTTKDKYGKEVYKNKAGAAEITLAKETNNGAVAGISYNGYAVSWSIDNIETAKCETVETEPLKAEGISADMGVSNVQTTVVYKGINENTDLYYTVSSKEIKEEIVLNDRESPNTYVFMYEIGNMNAELNEDNSVSIFNECGEIIYRITAPYMYDDTYETCEITDVSIHVESERMIYTFKADEEWLNDEEREYPVIIDPSIMTSDTIQNIRETYAARNDPNNASLKGYAYMKVGNPAGDNDIENEAYIKYDQLPQIDITRNVITEAVLVLSPHKRTTGSNTYCNEHSFSTDPIITASEITGSWELSTLTWNNRPSASSTILDYETLENSAAADERYYYWDITKSAEKWYKGTASNQGVVLKMYGTTPESSTWKNAYFSSSDSSSTPTAYYPRLVISYRNNEGLDGYSSTHSMSINGSGNLYINDFSGNLIYETIPLGSFNGERENTKDYYLVYNTTAALGTSDMKYSFGKGFRLNVSKRLLSSGISGYPYYNIDSTGTKHYFSDSSNDEYKDEEGLGMVLSHNNTDNNDLYWKITYKSGFVEIYDIWGYLRREIDTSGNTTWYNYSPNFDIVDNYLSSLSDPSVKTIELLYNSNRQLTTIRETTGNQGYINVTTFQYDSDGCLISINKNGRTIQLSYTTVSGKKLLNKIYESSSNTGNRYYVEIGYDNNKRVSRIGEGNEGVSNSFYNIYTNIEYKYNETTYTDYKGRQETIQFDGIGNAVCVKDDSGNIGLYEYCDIGNDNIQTNDHKISRSTVTQKYVRNGISDPLFENGLAEYTIDGPSCCTCELTETESLFSGESIKVTSPDTCWFSWADANIEGTQQEGDEYSFSAYIKTVEVEGDSRFNNTGAVITFFITDENGGNERNVYSEAITGTTDTSIDNGWRRIYTTATLGPNEHICYVACGLYFAKGTAYIGGMQLEKNGVANRINLMANSGLEEVSGGTPKKWTGYNTASSEGDGISSTSAEGTKSYKIVGNIRKDKYLKKETPLKGNAGDVLTVSAESLIQNGIFQTKTHKADYHGNKPTYKIEVTIHNNDNTTDVFDADYNTRITTWQYQGITAVAKKAYNSVTIKLKYSYNSGYVLFDAISLYKETSNSFTYDKDGNMVSAAENANQSVYSFDNNLPVKMNGPTGTGSETAYDENHNAVLVTTSEGVEQKLSYNSYGEVTKSTIQGNVYSYSVNPNNYYYIRAKYSGKTLKNASNTVEQSLYSGSQSQRWFIESTGDGFYKIKPQNDLSKAITVNTTNNTVSVAAAINDDSQKFSIMINEDGTYHISSKKKEDKVLTATGSAGMTGTGSKLNLSSYTKANTQKFYFTESEETGATAEKAKSDIPEDKEVYTLRLDYSGQILCLKDGTITNGNNIVQDYGRGIEDSRNRDFKLYYKSLSGGIKYYKIESICAAGKYIGTNNNDEVIINEYTSGNEPQWGFEYDSSTGYYYIRLKGTNKYIRLSGNTYSRNVKFVLSETKDSLSQFVCEHASETMTTSVTYTSNGRHIDKTTDNRGVTTEYSYNNRTEMLDSVTGPTSTTEYTYNSTTNEVNSISVRDNATNSNNSSEVSYTYGSNGSLASIGHNGFSYTFLYDCYGNRTEVKAAGNTLSANTYENRNGNLASTVYGNGNSINFGYDAFDRLIEKTYNNNNLLKSTVKYDVFGNITESYDCFTNDTTRYSYDLLKRVISSADKDKRINYRYDSFDRITNVETVMKNKTYSTNYIYGTGKEANMLKKEQKDGNDVIEYGYDYLTRLKNKKIVLNNTGTTPVIFETKYDYLEGNGANEGTLLIKSTEDNVSDMKYEYDTNGNITRITEDDMLVGSYSYDYLGQLIRADILRYGYTEEYEYDDAGNIIRKTRYSFTPNDEIPEGMGTTKTYVYDSVWKDKLVSYNGQSISYDAIGNPLNYMGKVLTWDYGRRLMNVTNGTNVINYEYNDSGIRTKKTVNGLTTKYILDGTKILSQTTGTDNPMYFYYDANGELYGFEYNGDNYWYVKNILGDIIYILNSQRRMVASYDYDPWGGCHIINYNSLSIGTMNPFRYRGYYYDQETGLYYLQSRYYDPTTGRFINADGQLNTGTIYGINVFAYCENNPINMSDPSGYRAVEDGPRSAWVMITNDNRIISCDSKTVKISPSKTSLAGIEFIANYESFHANKYDDGYGNPTIGYGHLINENDTFDSITQEEALDLLREELKGFEKSVAKYSLYKPIIWDQNQFDAFVSLAYNSGKYYRIVMDAIIDGDDPYNAFSKIVNSNGKFSLGLYRRRMDEADMFVYGTYKRTYRNLGE